MRSYLKYTDYIIGMQEVPKELSLIINIANCPYACPGCHTSYLQKDEGKNLKEDFENIINKLNKFVTCVCFMGDGQNILELMGLCNIAKNAGYKTCLYTGDDRLENYEELFPTFDYLKLGQWNEKLGGLWSYKTNQKFYILENGKYIQHNELFWTKEEKEKYEKSKKKETIKK